MPALDTSVRHLSILGATGSIGQSTLDVIARHPRRFRVHALTAHSRMPQLAQLAHAHAAKVVAVPSDAARQQFVDAWPGAEKSLPEIYVGPQALEYCASCDEIDTVMAAIVGTAGLPAVLAAARTGKRILLANKEALVAAGNLFMQTARGSGAQILPIDSEHNAIFQCLPQHDSQTTGMHPGVRRLILTASGGPFLHHRPQALHAVTPEQACAHPNWAMGRKISVDSATMMNKGLEVIEAHWLFAMPAAHIQVLIHPQSLVHSMVEYDDGSVLAQLGQPDMRTPIAHALAWPQARIPSGVGLLDLASLGRLDFALPDRQQFPCLQLAFDALATGQAACVVLNAANEIAVAQFLARQLPFTAIPRIIETTLSRFAGQIHTLTTLADILDLDAQTRTWANTLAAQSA